MKNRLQLLIKSVTTPSTQTAALCATRSIDKHFANFATMNINTSQSLSQSEHALICLLYSSGLRVSEVLRIRSCDIVQNRGIVITTSKSKQSVLVVPLYNHDFWFNPQKVTQLDVSTTDRFRLYRIMKQYGLSEIYGTNKKASVTHSGRHEITLATQNVKNDVNLLKQVLHHKSIKAQKYYVKQPKKTE